MARFRKKNVLSIISSILVVVLVFGALFGIISALTKSAEKETKKITLVYSVGGLDKNGNYSDSTSCIYTKTAFECYGLKTTLTFDSNITYQMFYYDKDYNFISSSNKIDVNYNSLDDVMPYETKYCRIAIMPNEDDNIKWYEVSKYAKQLKVEVSKNQNKSSGVYVAENVFTVDADMVGKYYNAETFENSTSQSVGTSTRVLASGYNKIKVVFPNLGEDVASNVLNNVYLIYFIDSTGNALTGYQKLYIKNNAYYLGSTDYYEIPTGTTYICMTYFMDYEEPELYLIP